MRWKAVLKGICTCALVCACAAPDERLWPPQPNSASQTIYVSLDAWHAMIAYHPEKSQEELPPNKHQQQDASLKMQPPVFEEWGYAERAWYLEGHQELTGVLRALFWPSHGVVEVGRHEQVWADRTTQPPSDLFIFQISTEGFHRLRNHLKMTILGDQSILTIDSTRFYPARRSYHVFHNCHQYAARALQEAGLPVSVFWAFNRSSLALQLERAAGMRTKEATNDP